MSIQDIKISKILKQWGQLLGRRGIADMIEEIAKEIASGDFSHTKEIIIRAGMIRALTEACKYDEYWDEKWRIGFSQILDRAEIDLIKAGGNHDLK